MLRFGAITDLHYCVAEPYLDRQFSETLRKIEEAADTLNSYDLDFLVNLGDTIDHGFLHFEKVLKQLSLFQAPVYTITGNHDYDVSRSEKEKVVTTLGLDQNYYEIKSKDVQLLFLDGNEVSTYAHEKKDKLHQLAEKKIEALNKLGAPNGQEYNGGIGQKQFNWLEKKLWEGNKEGSKTIIFCHFPIFPADKHNLLNDREVMKLIGKFPNVVAWICGHNHAGNYGKVNNCHVINLKGLVETKSHNSFAIFELKESSLSKQGFGRETNHLYVI